MYHIAQAVGCPSLPDCCIRKRSNAGMLVVLNICAGVGDAPAFIMQAVGTLRQFHKLYNIDAQDSQLFGLPQQVSAMYHIAQAVGGPPLPDCLSHEGRDFLRLCFNR